MFRAIGNLFGLGVARRARGRGVMGRLFGVGLTRRVARRGGITGGIARMQLATLAARIGLGVGAVAAGVVGARYIMQRRTDDSRRLMGNAPSTSMQHQVNNREEASLR